MILGQEATAIYCNEGMNICEHSPCGASTCGYSISEKSPGGGAVTCGYFIVKLAKTKFSYLFEIHVS